MGMKYWNVRTNVWRYGNQSTEMWEPKYLNVGMGMWVWECGYGNVGTRVLEMWNQY